MKTGGQMRASPLSRVRFAPVRLKADVRTLLTTTVAICTANWCALAALLVLLQPALSLGSPRSERSSAPVREWRSYGHDYTQQRFSRLRSINRSTVQKLGLKWRLDLPNETSLVATPLMVGETIFFTGKFSVVYAVSAATGKKKWIFDPKSRGLMVTPGRRMTANWGTSRGVAYWNGRIFVGAVDGRLIALSAQSGRELWSTPTLDPTTTLSISGAPLVANDKVLIGNAGGDWGPTRG